MRTIQDRDSFQAHLRKQLGFLERSCSAYDKGFRDEAVRAAVVLRVIFHRTSKSTSLLSHLGATHVKVLSTVDPVSYSQDAIDRGDVQFQGMVQIRMGSRGVELRPGLGDRGFEASIPAMNWWNQLVWVVGPGAAFRRRDIVLQVANRDGGAHVDRNLTREYEMLKRDIGVHYYVARPDGTSENGPLRDAHLVSLRQMGYEVLHSEDLRALSGRMTSP